VKKENSNPPKILSFFHTSFMHLYKNVNPLQSGIGEEGQLPYGMRVLEDLEVIRRFTLVVWGESFRVKGFLVFDFISKFP
jgi:hypothetical protein